MITIGIFLPAFFLTITGHEMLNSIVNNKYIHPFLDGVASAVIGLLLKTAFAFLKTIMVTGIDACVFFLTLICLFYFTNKYTPPILIIIAAITGQILYLK